MGSIMSKVQAYSQSSAGKKKIADSIADIQDNGGVAQSGARFRTQSDVEQAVEIMKGLLYRSADASGLPESVMEAFDEMSHSTTLVQPDGSATASISLGSDLSRQSLDPFRYSGIDNIVALFNRGYTASDHAYGYWHGIKMRSLKERPALYFMQAAVADFNSGHGASNNIVATLSDEY